MTRLRALTVGAGVPNQCERGRVHSVFRRACNIETDDGALLTVLAAENGRAPGAWTVDASHDLIFTHIFSIGAPVVWRAGVLRTGAVVIGTHSASQWCGRLDGLGARLNGPDIRAAFGVAARRFKTRSADTDVSAVAALPLARVRTLARAVRMGTPAAINNAINALIGCGPGLTPAGDDVLVGLLAGLYSTLPTGPRSHDLSSSGAMDTPPRSALLRTAALRIETVQAAMRAGIRRTNIISAACLLHATNGEFSERIATLARHIATGAAASATVRATDDALAVGASSGADGVLGLLLGLALGGRDAPAAYRQKGAVAARR